MKLSAQFFLTLEIRLLQSPDRQHIEEVFEIKLRGRTIPQPSTFFTPEELKDLTRLAKQEAKKTK